MGAVLNDFITICFSVIQTLINLVLTPIYALINTYLPVVGDALNRINTFMDNIFNTVQWVCSWFGFTSSTWWIIQDLIIYLLVAPISVATFRLAVKWFNSLKVG